MGKNLFVQMNELAREQEKLSKKRAEEYFTEKGRIDWKKLAELKSKTEDSNEYSEIEEEVLRKGVDIKDLSYVGLGNYFPTRLGEWLGPFNGDLPVYFVTQKGVTEYCKYLKPRIKEYNLSQVIRNIKESERIIES
ncbi:MAG: hypothetical protein ABH804_01790 [archaeon]